MTLPVSGAISFNNINVELGVAGTTQASLGQASYRTLAGVASGAISMSNFWGKANQFTFTISANQTNANLRTLAINAGWNQSSKVVATIASGVYISGNSTGTPALTINGSFPGGVDLVNNGTIVGMGGAGGAGRSINSGNTYGGAAGGGGGTALAVSSGVYIVNNGVIAGGGGGGGGGGTGYYYYTDKGQYFYIVASGGGGGGGRSSYSSNSPGGAAGAASGNWAAFAGAAGAAGTFAGQGGAGAGGTDPGNTLYGGAGGAGGAWGASGGAGNPGWPGGVTGLSGGSGGASVTGNGYISWGATGTRYGAIS